MVLKGKEIKEHKIKEMSEYISKLNKKISFVIFQVGDNFASNKYIGSKLKLAKELNMDAKLVKYPEDVTESEIIKDIKEVNENPLICGAMIQLPLPKHLDEYKLTQLIKKEKDIDGFNVNNIGLAYLNEKSLVSCTAKGTVSLLDYYNIPIEGKNITIAGRSNLVGKILALLLINRGATVTVCNSKTKDIKKYIDHSDIFISAIGIPHHFKAEHFKDNKGITVVDIGINRKDGKVVGDVDFDGVVDLVSNITPVPGGIGVLTVTELMQNIIIASELQKRRINGNS